MNWKDGLYIGTRIKGKENLVTHTEDLLEGLAINALLVDAFGELAFPAPKNIRQAIMKTETQSSRNCPHHTELKSEQSSKKSPAKPVGVDELLVVLVGGVDLAPVVELSIVTGKEGRGENVTGEHPNTRAVSIGNDGVNAKIPIWPFCLPGELVVVVDTVDEHVGEGVLAHELGTGDEATGEIAGLEELKS